MGRWATSLAMWMAGRWWASAAATVLRWMLVAMVMFVLDPDLLRSVSDPALGGFGHRSWVLALQTRWLEGFRGNLLAGVAATPMAVPLGVAFLVGGFGEELLSSTPPRSSGENLRPPCPFLKALLGGCSSGGGSGGGSASTHAFWSASSWRLRRRRRRSSGGATADGRGIVGSLRHQARGAQGETSDLGLPDRMMMAFYRFPFWGHRFGASAGWRDGGAVLHLTH